MSRQALPSHLHFPTTEKKDEFHSFLLKIIQFLFILSPQNLSETRKYPEQIRKWNDIFEMKIKNKNLKIYMTE